MLRLTGKLVLVVLLILLAGYYYVSSPQRTIDSLTTPQQANNLHLIEQDSATGYAIYRLGQPDAADIRALCQLGVSEIVVMAGTALDNEFAYRDQCPELRVIYNHDAERDFIFNMAQRIDCSSQPLASLPQLILYSKP